MAYNLCPSPSAAFYHPLCNTLSSSSSPRSSSLHLKLLSLKNHTSLLPASKASLQPSASTNLSTQESPERDNLQNPDGKPTKSYVWVNPKSSRAARLWKNSYDARYASLIKVARSLDRCNPNLDDVSNILGGLGGLGMEDDAVLIINNMSNPDTALLALKYFTGRGNFRKEVIIYNVTLKVIRERRQLWKAEQLFDEMVQRGVKPDNATFSTIISCASLSGLPHKAVEWFEKMPSFGLEPDDITLSSMIDSYGLAGNIDMALSFYDRARTEKWRLDAITFATLIRIYGMAGNFDGCLNVYEEMKALGVKPNLVTYNTLLDAMGRAMRPWQAKQVYNEMLENGVSPSVGTYTCLLRAYKRGKYSHDALHVYKAMKQKGVKLDVVLYNTLLALCDGIGAVDEATQIMEDMKDSGTSPDSRTFSAMISLFSSYGNVSEAEKYLNEMMEAGFEPTLFVLTSLIQCYGKHQLTDKIVSAFNGLVELGITPDDRFCGCILSAMTQTSRDSLGKLVGCVESANPVLGSVVKLIMQEQGNSEKFKEAAAELFDSIDAEVKKAYCNSLCDLCVNLNMSEKASELLELGLTLEIYTGLQSRSSTQWSLHLRSLSCGAALTALHVWINDLSKEMESGEGLPPLLGINTGHGQSKFGDKSLANVFESYLKELGAPFQAPDNAGWFLTTRVAAESWLDSRKSSDAVAA